MEEQIHKLEIDVSIIIVNYNSTALLKNCIDSVQKYTIGINFEIVVVDNNSTTGDIDELLKFHDRITLIKNDINRGFGAANNQGVEIAKGKYVLLLNNDTILFENTIKKVFDFADTLEGNEFIGCKLLNEDKSIQKSVYDFPSLLNVFTSNLFLYLFFPKSKYFNKYHLMNKGLNDVTEVDVVTGAFIFMHRKIFDALGGFDERFFFYMEETDLCYRFKQSGGKVVYFSNTQVIHLKGKTANKNLNERFKNESIAAIKYYQKHFQGMEFFLVVLFHYFGMLIRIPVFFVAGLLKFRRDWIHKSFNNLKNLFVYPSNLFKHKSFNK